MKIYKSLDFANAKKRIEKTESGPYLVHLEDYESLNDLINRSIRTKTRFVPEKNPNAVYDDLDSIREEFDKADLNQHGNSADLSTEEPKRSDGESVSDKSDVIDVDSSPK